MAMAAQSGTSGQAAADDEQVLGDRHQQEVRPAVADSGQQRQLAPPLEHVAQQHRRQADRAEQQTETAERLERRQIRVLDAVERREVLAGLERRRRRRRSVPARSPDATSATVGRGLDQQQLEARLIGKQPPEVRLRHQQLALEDAVAKRGHEPQRHRRAAARDDEVVADAAVQHVGHRVGVGNDRNRAVRLDAVEQQPRIRALRRRSRPPTPGTRKRPSARKLSRGATIRGLVGWYRFRQLASSPGRTRNGSIVVELIEGEEIQRVAARPRSSDRERSAAASAPSAA